MASKTKGYVKVAYWDTEKSGPVPNILGEIRGTPTIKLLRPKRRNKGKNNKVKDVVDYNMERKADDLSTFALDMMPSFVERVNGPEDFEKFKNKAGRFGLPMMLFFSEDRRISNEMKFLSTEFRRRVLVAQIPFAKKENKNIFFEYGVRGRALLVVPPASENNDAELGDDGNGNPSNLTVFDGKWNLHRLQGFFSEHALKSEVKQPKPTTEKKKKKEEEEEEATKKKTTEPPVEKQKVKTEL